MVVFLRRRMKQARFALTLLNYTEFTYQPFLVNITKPKLTPMKNAILMELSESYRRLEAAHERLSDKESVIVDLREDRDKWRQQATPPSGPAT